VSLNLASDKALHRDRFGKFGHTESDTKRLQKKDIIMLNWKRNRYCGMDTILNRIQQNIWKSHRDGVGGAEPDTKMFRNS
jgi:hypothetical protein